MKSAFIYTSAFDTYSLGTDHPFKPYKASMVYELCYRYGLFDHPWIKVHEPQPSAEEVMAEYHSREYIDALKSCNGGTFDFTMIHFGLGTSDNPIFKGVYDFSLLVLGATIEGAQLISSGEADTVFSPVGGLHHGGYGHAEGFCYVNDIVIAIKRLLGNGYKRILYVDIDAHHGNGVQDAFYDTDQVLFLSLHQNGETIYPGTGFENEIGEGKGKGYTVNLPLPEYTDDEVYVRAFKEVFPPLVDAYRPECVVAQIGLDTLKKDPLTNLRLTNNGYCAVMEEIRRLSPQILALGGGGYSVPDVVRGWTLAWAILNGIKPVDHFLGSVGSGVYGHGKGIEDLYDQPHRVSDALRKSVDIYVDNKIAYIKSNVFPLLGIGT
ncbi:MAG TPA: acetoin utilization protein AcuC [Deltaproteobacteria bacterium]|nr:acetoin utilization protein AcuC [Deltaproteobacteria bacterium]HPR54837.1 acetoin utilization protein AcuC [Deltaproteobacteria bacterium]HXK46538.1 acetoin utilization protein AcuC [Deltaproteobacteria bacterium]